MIGYGNLSALHPRPVTSILPSSLVEDTNIKTMLMFSNAMINRAIVIGFMVLVGFSVAKSIYSASVLGLSLALVSLGAGIYCLKLLHKMNEAEKDEVI